MLLFVALSIVTASMGAARPDVSVVPRPSGASFVAGVAEQVKRCYRSPRVSRAARRITTRMLVRYTSDGMLTGQPVVLSQVGGTHEGSPFADVLAEGDIHARHRVTPSRLPPEDSPRDWDDLGRTISHSSADVSPPLQRR